MTISRKHLYMAIAVAVVAVCLLLSGRCYRNGHDGLVQLDSSHRLIMGTFARVVAVAKDQNTARKCIKTAFEQLTTVDNLMSDYKSDSEISKVNRDAFKQAVEVSAPTFEVLQKSIEFSKLSAGAFDVTVGPLVELFRLAEEKGVAPSEYKIAQAKQKAGFEKLKLDEQNRTVQFTVDGMRLDLGGIAKGYAVDKAVEAMQEFGALGGMVDIGGDIRVFGRPADGRDNWLVGLQDPEQAKDQDMVSQIPSVAASETLLVLELTDAAAATSGDYRRFALIDGKKYSHIIDTKTGYGKAGPSSVTIIAENATDADALATAVSVLGREKGLELVESLPKTEAILIPSGPEQQLVFTKGARQYIKTDTRNSKTQKTKQGAVMSSKYEVLKATEPIKLNGDWAGGLWGRVPALEINQCMGEEAEHKPKAAAKLLYDDQHIYIIFRVEDKYVRAVAKNHQDKVWQDSCVEFFFTPSEDISLGYFNIEVNCGGTMLFHYQPAPKTDMQLISPADCERVKIFHSEPKIIEPEKQQEPTVWVVEYSVPIEILEKYCSISKPRPGVIWRANFYKCGDNTSHPHWLTFSAITSEKFDFHQPEFFGTLEFR